MSFSLTSAPATVIRFIKESRDELRKVSWPTRQTTLQYTLIVIIASLAVGLLIGGIDYLFTLLVEQLLF